MREFRVYSFVDEPLRVGIFTIDEILIGFSGLLLAVFMKSEILRILTFTITVAGLFLYKRFKKAVSGFSLLSFMHWHVGLRIGLPKAWPQSAERLYLP